MNKNSTRAHNEHFHVYILSTKKGKMLKIGKSNNTRRTQHLARMGYAGFNDWIHIATFPMSTNYAAVALESMLIARLAGAGHQSRRISWTNLLNDRKSYADECFTCEADLAIEAAQELSHVYSKHVVPIC